MNTNAKRGTKVLFSHPNSGYTADQEQAKKHLVVGNTYTIDRTEVESWHTDVFLQEVPGQAFNSVMFDDEVDV